MPKAVRVAGEVDSYCTKCRLVLNHRVVSMKAGKAYQVECLTCRSTHLWRQHAPGDKPAPGERAARTAPATGVARKTARPAAPRPEELWEKAIAGRAVSEFRSYSVGETFRDGDLLRHKRFGDGVVTRIVDAHKIEVLFRDEARTLAQGLT